MRRNGDVYEYLGTYVDDLIIAAKNPNELFDVLVNKYKLQLKGTEKLRYHLGADYFRDEDGTLCQSARGYVERMSDNFERMFGHKPREYKSPLEPNDHPELDLTPELDEDGTQMYQSLIGSLQWTVSLGRIDVATAVMTMSGFCANPRKGHLDRVKRIIGYAAKFKHATLRYRTNTSAGTSI